METKDFFQDILDLENDLNLTRASIDKFKNDVYLNSEITRLKFYLMNKDKEDRIIVATWVIDNLMHAYYQTRQKVDGRQRFDINRSLMFFYSDIINAVFVSVLWTLKIKFDEDFIREWELKTSYFPFKFLFEGKPMPFIERERRKKLSDNGMVLPKELDTDETLLRLQESQQQAENNTQTNKTETHIKTNKVKGRPKGTLKDKMICEDADKVLSKLHQLMNDRKGKEAALIITACIKAGIMTKPTFKQVFDEFGDIGNQSGYNKNMRESPFTDMEIEAIIKKLKE